MLALQRKEIILILLILSIAALMFFARLGDPNIQIWDESRLAINAMEMYETGFSPVTTFNYEPDLWNTKPPLMIWCQVACMKIFGVNEFAVRLPSAISAFLLIAFFLFYFKKYFDDLAFGAIVSAVLLGSAGFVSKGHLARSGDYDSMFILFATISFLYYFLFVERGKPLHVYLYMFFLAFTVLTKSVQPLMFAPFLLMYTVARKKLIRVLMNVHFWFALLIFLALVITYYAWRESVSPGYLQAAWVNDAFGRFKGVDNNINRDTLFYLKTVFFTDHWVYWFFPALLGIVWAVFDKNNPYRTLVIYCGLCWLGYEVIISLANTKLVWYAMAGIPLAAITAGYFVIKLAHLLSEKTAVKNAGVMLIILLVSIPVIINFTSIFNRANQARADVPLTSYLRQLSEKSIDVDTIVVVYDDYVPQNTFYMRKLNLRKFPIRQEFTKKIAAGDEIVIGEGKELDELSGKFQIIDRKQLAPGVFKIKFAP